MDREQTETAQKTSEGARGTPSGVASRWLVGAFPWHLRVFLVANIALNTVNVSTGGNWWAFWPLVATAFVLAIHYFVYKAAVAEERWVEARVEELNLKSYDRSHIEDLKARYAGKRDSADRQS